MKMVLAKRQLTVVLYDMYVCVSVSVDVSVCVCVCQRVCMWGKIGISRKFRDVMKALAGAGNNFLLL